MLDEVWPEYNNHGEVMVQHFGRVEPELPEFQMLLVNEDKDEVVARARTIPVRWDGTASGLPEGIEAALVDGLKLRDEGGTPDALCALAAEVRPDRQGQGLSAEILKSMRACAGRDGLSRGLIAPVRPSWKERYPITPIERYAAWTRPDGLPLDPWMRVHARLGAHVLKTAPRSLKITGTVSEWESWVDMEFPESGTYVFPRGLSTVEIDVEIDLGTYFEPNVWMHHR